MTHNPPKKAFLQSFVERYVWNTHTNERSVASTPVRGSYSWLTNLFGYKSKSGITVNEKAALSIPAYFRACNILENTTAQLPWQVFERTENGKRLAREHYAYPLLHDSPHPLMNSFIFRKVMIGNAIQTGNGIARIVRNEKGVVTMFEVWDGSVPVRVGLKDGQLWYVRTINSETEIVPSNEIFHIMGYTRNGYEGISLLEYAKDNLGNTLAGQERTGELNKNGALLTGLFTAKGKVNSDAREEIRQGFRKYASKGRDAGGVIVLSEGETFTPVQMTPKDSQFAELAKMSVADVSRWTGVPQHLLADLDRTTHNNGELQKIDLQTFTLMPWVVQFEQEAQRKIFNQDKNNNYFSEMNFDGLLRADAQTRGELYKSMFSVGAISSNEIRAKENMNPIDGGNEYFVPLNHIPLSKIDDYVDSITDKGNSNE